MSVPPIRIHRQGERRIFKILLAAALANDGIVRFRLTLAKWLVEVVIIFGFLVGQSWFVRGVHGQTGYPS
jgi:hypothetical protein